MTLYRVRVKLSGWEGGDGVNVYHFESLSDDNTDEISSLLHNAYDGVKGYLLAGLKVDVDPEALEIEPATGILTATHQMPTQPTVSGNGVGGGVPRSTMAVVRHNTDLIYEGQRVNGRTYVGPVAQNAIDGSGHIAAAAQTAFANMFNGLQDINGARLMVYHRPRKATQTRPGSAGKAGHVQSSLCLAQPGGLRSRRD